MGFICVVNLDVLECVYLMHMLHQYLSPSSDTHEHVIEQSVTEQRDVETNSGEFILNGSLSS